MNRRAVVTGAAAGLLWLTVVSVGLTALMDYDTRPGLPARAPVMWPADSRIERASDRPTLVMLAHPRCDCTRASLGELAELLARAESRPRTYVVFIKPGRTGVNWEQSAVWQAARAIPGVTVLRDDEGVEAQRFGVETSGQTMLYDTRGYLMFSGGDTAARGKAGDNIGRASVLSILNGHAPSTTSTPVFGCPLFGPGDKDSHAGAHANGL